MTNKVALGAEFCGRYERTNFLSEDAVSSAAADLTRQGAFVAYADVSDLRSSEGLFRELGTQLSFPEGFGNNWDALYDVWKEIKESWPFPVALIVSGVGSLSAQSAARVMQLAVFLDGLERDLAEGGNQLVVLFNEDSYAPPGAG